MLILEVDLFAVYLCDLMSVLHQNSLQLQYSSVVEVCNKCKSTLLKELKSNIILDFFFLLLTTICLSGSWGGCRNLFQLPMGKGIAHP